MYKQVYIMPHDEFLGGIMGTYFDYFSIYKNNLFDWERCVAYSVFVC
jgi:hypothetical protein